MYLVKIPDKLQTSLLFLQLSLVFNFIYKKYIIYIYIFFFYINEKLEKII